MNSFQHTITQPIVLYRVVLIIISDPPEVSAAERAVYPGIRGKADLTCIVKAEPRANVSMK